MKPVLEGWQMKWEAEVQRCDVSQPAGMPLLSH